MTQLGKWHTHRLQQAVWPCTTQSIQLNSCCWPAKGTNVFFVILKCFLCGFVVKFICVCSPLTLYIGIPVIPSWYKARWPQVESPEFEADWIDFKTFLVRPSIPTHSKISGNANWIQYRCHLTSYHNSSQYKPAVLDRIWFLHPSKLWFLNWMGKWGKESQFSSQVDRKIALFWQFTRMLACFKCHIRIIEIRPSSRLFKLENVHVWVLTTIIVVCVWSLSIVQQETTRRSGEIWIFADCSILWSKLSPCERIKSSDPHLG